MEKLQVVRNFCSQRFHLLQARVRFLAIHLGWSQLRSARCYVIDVQGLSLYVASSECKLHAIRLPSLWQQNPVHIH